jgi:glutathione S-transferase
LAACHADLTRFDPNLPFTEEPAMNLYYSPSACSFASNIALHEAGIGYDKTLVDLSTHKTADGRDFYAINDKGYVPYLILDNGEGLSEGVAILQYIADLKPESKLAPVAGSLERVRLQEWLTYINSEVHKTLGGLFDSTMHAETRAKTIQRAGSRLDWLSKHLKGKDYLLGADFSVADGYLFTVLNWGQWVGIDIAKWPVLSEYMARVSARPKVQEAMREVGLIK